ncbi:MAG: TlpA family protein disulfide reductase [Gemmatimonadaceae bacterium]|nr:TlpA family protein disulfide reductase [Gemmatimonadaceae bacterium]
MQTKLLSTVALALSMVPAIDGAGAQEIGIAVGSRAPSAVVQTLDGKSVDLGSYVGKTPMLIEFWATWCPKCEELEPALMAAQRKYGARVKFIGVAVSVRQSPARLKAYAAKHKLTHEILFDADGNATDAYEVPATSYVVVVNRKGNVVYTGLGGSQNLEAAIRKAL